MMDDLVVDQEEDELDTACRRSRTGEKIDPRSESAVLQLQVSTNSFHPQDSNPSTWVPYGAFECAQANEVVADALDAARQIRSAAAQIAKSLRQMLGQLSVRKLHSSSVKASALGWVSDEKPFHMEFHPPSQVDVTGTLLCNVRPRTRPRPQTPNCCIDAWQCAAVVIALVRTQRSGRAWRMT
jgi:hypothetical protein